jgi:multidrug efflux pump
MITGTTLAVIFVPVFFVVVRGLFKSSERQKRMYAEHAHAAGMDEEESHEGKPHV